VKKLLASATFGLLVGFSVSCDDDEGNDDGAAHLEACEMIVDACHEKDDGTDEMIHDYCHQAAHDGVDGHGDAAVCSQRAEECVEVCNAAPPVEGHETEAHETGGHDGSGG
jgi:hypothetical protein